jgi:phospholipase D1/2
LLPLLAIGIVWYLADLSRYNSVAKVTAAALALRDSPTAFLYVLLAFGVGTLFFFPVTVLITGTVLAFDPVRGFCFAFVGTLLGASLTYGAGRLLGGHALDYVSGPRMRDFGDLMRKHAIRATIAARLLPVGSFSGLNLFAGSLRIPFRWYFLGNVIGIFPSVLFLTLFADTLSAAVRAPSWQNLTGVVLAVALMLAALVLYRRRKRREAESAASSGMA